MASSDNNNFERWLKLAEFRGRTIEALTNVDKEINSLRLDMTTQCGTLSNKLDKLTVAINKRMNRVEVKVAGIAGAVSIIVTLIALVIQSSS